MRVDTPRRTYGTAIDPSKCPLPNFRDPHLVRQVHLLHLDRQKLSRLQIKYGHKLSQSLRYFLTFYGQILIDLPDVIETELLEFLEWYSDVLDLTHELIDNLDYECNSPLTEVELEALQLSCEIEMEEADDFYTQLFDGVKSSNLITADIRTICNNAREINEY
jgi:hypothetical protein